ncbi:MAG: CopG family transcriptional regulator [Kovacikia sp.]
MTRKTLDDKFSAFVKGDDTNSPSTEDTGKQSNLPEKSTAQSKTKLLEKLTLPPKDPRETKTITILASRRKRLKRLADQSGRSESELIGLMIDDFCDRAGIGHD